MKQTHNPIKSLNLNVFEYIKNIIWKSVNKEFEGNLDLNNVVVELPKDKSHGDFSTNVAMVLSSKAGMNPRAFAEQLKNRLAEILYFHSVEVAGPGFINIRVTPDFWRDFIKSVYQSPEMFGHTNVGYGKKVLVEFVSANPTGPMHVGHSRGAVYGDALAKLLKAVGFEVVREYYVNDAGSQVRILAQSLFIRYQQLFGKDVQIQDGMYPGEYLIEIAKALKDETGDSLLGKEFEEIYSKLHKFAVDKIMELIKGDLEKLGVKHDVFTHELDLHDAGYIENAIGQLEEKGLLYRGVLEAPKGFVLEDWEPKEQTIFKSTEFGDDVDRSVRRADGTFTYFAGDFGLTLNRLDRGFNDVVMVLGADHIGFVKRIKAVTSALSDGKAKIDVPVVQLVNLFKNGEPFKMSKRSGNFISVEDVVDEVGVDALRFVLLSRKNDTVIDFDFDKIKEQTKENPVFYVQYAHARCASVLRNALGEFQVTPNLDKIYLLSAQADQDLIRKISLFPKIVEQAALHHEPHRVIYYAIELATEFHAFWAKGTEESDLRFIIPDNPDLTSARLILVDLVKLTIRLALGMLGIKAIDKM
jgi:arginyl-tRNA synthetase